uniref:ATP synthase F(1) complex subunit delta, mitochondrial n=1 Tax=Suricata suricatta TaxID=37032 RepID=A0A673UAA8_SURSU
MLPVAVLRRPGLRCLVRQARAYAEAAAAPAPAAGPGQMSFTFASPTQVFFNGANVRQVDVPTQTGAFGILAAHVPTLQVLRPGLVVVHAEDGTTSKYFVSSGSVTVNADSSVQLLAEEAVTLDMLDVGVSVPGKADISRKPDLGQGTRRGPCLTLTCYPLPTGSQDELGEGAGGAVRGSRRSLQGRDPNPHRSQRGPGESSRVGGAWSLPAGKLRPRTAPGMSQAG